MRATNRPTLSRADQKQLHLLLWNDLYNLTTEMVNGHCWQCGHTSCGVELFDDADLSDVECECCSAKGLDYGEDDEPDQAMEIHWAECTECYAQHPHWVPDSQAIKFCDCPDCGSAVFWIPNDHVQVDMTRFAPVAS